MKIFNATERTNNGIDAMITALEDALESGNFEVISLASTDYTNTKAKRGFSVYVDSITGGTNVKVDGADSGEGITITSASAGNFLMNGARCTKVYKTGTTATTLIAVW
jgi:hypothetical protein